MLIDSNKVEKYLNELMEKQSVPFLKSFLSKIDMDMIGDKFKASGCHCRECSKWNESDDSGTGRCWVHHIFMDEDDFCSRGVPR